MILEDLFDTVLGKVIIFITVVIILIFGIFPSLNDHEYTATVTDKDRVVYSDSSRYLIYTELTNGEVHVFQDTDELIRGKFNSSDLYAMIKVGKTYRFRVIGWRIPFLSQYENIISFEEVA